jgi:hypothetical protein
MGVMQITICRIFRLWGPATGNGSQSCSRRALPQCGYGRRCCRHARAEASVLSMHGIRFSWSGGVAQLVRAAES